MKKFIFAVILLLVLEDLSSESRVALIIGNGEYKYNTTLKNPKNDAIDMADLLRSQGFDTILTTNTTLQKMYEVIREFGNKLQKDTIAVFYYSGHGVQVKGKNFFLAVDQDIASEDEIPFKSIDYEMVLAKMESAQNAMNIVFLDCCRNNPFPGSSRSAQKGLSVIGTTLPESIVVYSAEPGKTASDGDGRNSPFTKALLEYLPEDLEILSVLKKVKAEVVKDTNNSQSPRVDQNLSKDFYFNTDKKNIVSEMIDVDNSMLSNFQNMSLENPWGGKWYAVNDTPNNGDSSATIDLDVLESKKVMHFDYSLGKKFQYRYAMVQDNFTSISDLSAYSQLEIKMRGSGNAIRVEVGSESVKDHWYHGYSIKATPGNWTIIRIPFSKLTQYDFAKKVKIDMSKINIIQFTTTSMVQNEKGWIEIEYLKLLK